MTDRYEKIRKALAMGPTPGPWGLKELPRDMQRDGYKFSISRRGLGCWIAKVTHEANGGSGAANAALIAACDPDTTRALLEERDALREALKVLVNWIPSADTYRRLGFDPETPMRAHEAAKAALRYHDQKGNA